MKAKQMAALCSVLGLTLSGAAYADSGMSSSSNQPQFFGQGCDRIMDEQVMSDRDKDGKMMVPQGINHPGRIHPTGSNDFFVTATFIYWMANTDGMNVNQFPFNNGLGLLIAPTGNGKTYFQKPKFKPGFKVGIGYDSDWDDWTAYLEYTWLHQTVRQTTFANEPGSFDNVFVLSRPVPFIASDVLSNKWRMNLDMGDFTLGRAYYVGKRVVFEPFGGLRAAWIHQKFTQTLSNSSNSSPWAQFIQFIAGQEIAVTDILTAVEKSNSWGLGPRVGMHNKWLLGCGFRLDALASASLLFTRYTNISVVEGSDLDLAAGSTAETTTTRYYKHYDTVRPNAELGLGFGWGSYLGDDNGYYFDLSARYDFNIFWDQTMFRGLADSVIENIGNYPTDLTFHGLTASVRLDF